MTFKGKWSFFFGIGFLTQVYAQEDCCLHTHDLNRVSLRHIEARGIGYDKGYTSLEGLFIPLPSLTTRWVPFLDVRGHLFNNSKPAANAGIGLRYIDTRVWGANIYYDYRKTSHHTYNQISFGLESLGRYLDYRVNGYFPLGSDKSSLYDLAFHSFSGNSLYIARKQELALQGCNGEIGIHIAKIKGIDFYSALGPYYFGNSKKHTVGGEFRIGMDVMHILRLEGNASYDHLFKWIGQGQISLSYAFTPKTLGMKEKKRSCSFRRLIRERAFQRVDKQEIIVTTTQHKKSVALNPLTGSPFVFVFVDNTSHSQGTYESPFNKLADAQHASNPYDIIAVLPGNGTDVGLDQGIVLQEGQKLWGMSIIHSLPTTLGNIRIKPSASQMPILSNVQGGSNPVVTAANNNEIAGLRIVDTQGNGGIEIEERTGNYWIENNIISVFNSGIAIGLIQVTGNVAIINNTFIGAELNGIGVGALLSGSMNISNNVFRGMQKGIFMVYAGTPLDCSIVSNNMYFSPAIGDTDSAAIELLNGEENAESTFFIADNTSSSNSKGGSPLIIEFIPGFFATLRHNSIKGYFPETGSYGFLSNFGGSVSQINFAPDNEGSAQYLGL